MPFKNKQTTTTTTKLLSLDHSFFLLEKVDCPVLLFSSQIIRKIMTNVCLLNVYLEKQNFTIAGMFCMGLNLRGWYRLNADTECERCINFREEIDFMQFIWKRSNLPRFCIFEHVHNIAGAQVGGGAWRASRLFCLWHLGKIFWSNSSFSRYTCVLVLFALLAFICVPAFNTGTCLQRWCINGKKSSVVYTLLWPSEKNHCKWTCNLS